MKKPALTSLLLLLAIKSVSACSYISDSEKSFSETLADISFYKTIYFTAIFLLFAANAALLIAREKPDKLFAAILIGLALLMIPITFFGMLLEGCETLFSILKVELGIIIAVLAFHLGLLATGTRLPDWRMEKDEMISLKIR